MGKCLLVYTCLLGRVLLAGAQETFVPNPSESVLVRCSDLVPGQDTCNHGECCYQRDDMWPDFEHGTCRCERKWATVNSSEPCMYARHSQQTMLLMQLLLGPIAPTLVVLGWKNALLFHWGFVLYGAITFWVSKRLSEALANDPQSGVTSVASVVSACLSYASFVVVVFFWAFLCFLIGGSHCIDSNGVYCY